MTAEEQDLALREIFAAELVKQGLPNEAAVIVSKDYAVMGGVFAAALDAMRRLTSSVRTTDLTPHPELNQTRNFVSVCTVIR